MARHTAPRLKPTGPARSITDPTPTNPSHPHAAAPAGSRKLPDPAAPGTAVRRTSKAPEVLGG
jgi:hypothetical protein